MNSTRRITYFSACQKICRMYINKLKRKNTQKFIVLNEERIASIRHKSTLSKFHSVRRDVNFSTRKSPGRAFLNFTQDIADLEEKGK